MKQMISMVRGYPVDVTRFLDNYMTVHTQKGISPKNCDAGCDHLSAHRAPILDITPSELEIERAILGINHRDFFEIFVF